MISQSGFGKNVQGSSHGLICNTIVTAGWRYWRKPQKYQ